MTEIALPEPNHPASSPTREPWEKRPSESFKAFQAFAVYRDLGYERSLSKVREALDKDLTLLARWSAKHAWVERAEAYDLHVDQRMRDQRESRIDEANRRAEGGGLALQRAALTRIRGGRFVGADGEEHDVEGIDPAALDPHAAAKWLELGIKLEHFGLGTIGDVTRDVRRKSDVEWRRLVGGIIEAAIEEMEREHPSVSRFVATVQAIAAEGGPR